MLAMDVWCFSKSTIRVDLEKHQTRLHYWGNSLCNFEESPLQLWVFLLCTKHELARIYFIGDSNKQYGILPFPSLIGLEDNEKESKLHKYLDGEDSPFFKTFFAFSSMILKEIYKKISQ